jgi:hypothetical protein
LLPIGNLIWLIYLFKKILTFFSGFCPPPPPPQQSMIGDEYWVWCSAYRLSTCQRAGSQVIPVSIDGQALNSSVTVLRQTDAVSLLEIWTSKDYFLISGSEQVFIGNITKFIIYHHHSSTSRNLTIIVFIAMVSPKFFNGCCIIVCQSLRCNHYLSGTLQVVWCKDLKFQFPFMLCMFRYLMNMCIIARFVVSLFINWARKMWIWLLSSWEHYCQNNCMIP